MITPRVSAEPAPDSAAASKDSARRPVRLAGKVVTDGESEARLRQRIQQLESLLATRDAELVALTRELATVSRSISHDLRAPLRAIDGYSAMLATELGNRLSGEAGELFQRTRTAARNMGEMIDKLLDLSRASCKTLDRQPLDLSGLAAEAVEALTAATADHDVEIEIQPGLRAEADHALMHAALGHLLGNAWKFTSHRLRPRVRFHALRTEAGEDAFCVEDNGAGFDMRYAHKLFGAFQRLHHPRDFPGSGVGLATVARIVQRHSGRVWAEGEPEKGARFYFTLAPAP